MARNLIAHSDARILDIAIECGFASEPHFATLFRQHYGLSPRAYRLTRTSHESRCIGV
ncbi:helix-turn-helix domain-containing protein [Ferruginivarius sediminum]|uniref:Helix-turn-helix domain-containing protein n=1 Tax=Ferruginivarius sediminum TaxID=2661937 RepID=A0A369T4H7_9PROT|nr:helix-turn-helix domain-containing protein [Ferruginivarius sediminum]